MDVETAKFFYMPELQEGHVPQYPKAGYANGLECTSENWITVDITKRRRETLHTAAPQTENARFPNWVRSRRTAVVLVVEGLRWRLSEYVVLNVSRLAW